MSTEYGGAVRVVSLLPSATETMAAIGASDLLVARSCDCDWPADLAARVPSLTRPRTELSGASDDIDAHVREHGRDLYELDADALIALRPDVILTQDLCDVCSVHLETVERVARKCATPPRIVSLNPNSIWDVLDDCLRVGESVGREADARDATARLRDRLWTAFDAVTPFVDGPRVLVLEWLDPLFVAAHWTPELIERCGGRAVLGEAGKPSRAFTPEEIAAASPDAVLIAPCGMTVERAKPEVERLMQSAWWRALPFGGALPITHRAATHWTSNHVVLLDGTASFSRPGPRLVDLAEWMAGWMRG
ncbi:MAG: ABC transporter substrate-binding protein [Planctomycetota bacterium]|nr:ABC transporter substrate-binding protein [Planctomycetota bacterium]